MNVAITQRHRVTAGDISRQREVKKPSVSSPFCFLL